MVSAFVVRDVFANRPTDNSAATAGRLFFATDTGVHFRDNGVSWDVDGHFYGSGSTGSRPTVTIVGAQFQDTTLNKPVFWDGAAWRDAAGTIV